MMPEAIRSELEEAAEHLGRVISSISPADEKLFSAVSFSLDQIRFGIALCTRRLTQIAIDTALAKDVNITNRNAAIMGEREDS